MPLQYLARLTDAQRTARSNLHLGAVLAFVAGAVNAGGFLAIGLYTSHMTGLVSAAADAVALGHYLYAGGALAAVLCFAAGAATTAVLVNVSRRRWPARVYVPSLLLESSLLLLFGLLGTILLPHKFIAVSLTALLLCFIMGLQNALITKVSDAQIRTTHLTGLITDLGIELGRLAYRRGALKAPSPPSDDPTVASRARLRIQATLVTAFFVGGVVGALGFKHLGFVSTVPLALALLALALLNFMRASLPS